MRNKQLTLSLTFLLLTALVSAAFTLTASAQEGGPLVIPLSSTGQGRGHAVAYSPDSQTLAVGSSLGIHFFDPSSNFQSTRFIPAKTWVRALAFSPDGELLASGSYDPIVRLWDARDGTIAKELSGHTGWVRALAFSPDGELLATASDDNTVCLWSVTDGMALRVFTQRTEGVKAVAFSPDGVLLATGGYDNIIRLWRVSDGSLVRELAGHTGWVRALAFSPNGEFLASGAFDATLRLWRVADGALLVTREEHNSSVLSVAFSPDGRLLASASVDETVRLWKIPDAEPYDLLRGHSDFVFSVAFSPDGKTLASASVDNSVRIWDVPQQTSPSAQEMITAPSDCRACHHQLSNAKPARVSDVDCATCHTNGTMVRNWDPSFPRAGSSSPISIVPETGIEVGVSSQKQDLAVQIISLANGETFYAGENTPLYSVLLNGVVFSNSYPLQEVNLLVEVLQNDRVLDSIRYNPKPDGSFSLPITVNPDSSMGDEAYASPLNKLQTRCGGSCHFRGDLNLSAGSIYVRVTAIIPSGERASDSRLIRVEQSSNILMPVKVLLNDGKAPTEVPIQATTRLYEWRGRIFNAVSDAKGNAALQVEALSLVPTTYQISVPPVVVDGILYESTKPVEITLPPGATTAPLVTLQVQARTGQINGHIQDLGKPVQVWAIQLPDGSSQSVMTSAQGAFSFANLRVNEYIITADPQALAGQGLTLAAQPVDLSQLPSTEVELAPHSLEGAAINGLVTDEDGIPLPFAWVSAETQTRRVASASGAYSLWGLPASGATVIVSAPGYYSQARLADASSLDFELALRPETKLLPWGTGTMILPPETVARVEGKSIAFEQGWLWGQGGEAEPLILQVNGAQITLLAGSFALERLPAQDAWFYLFDGEARVQPSDGRTPIEVGAGQMVRIATGESIQAVDYDLNVVQALHPVAESPLSPSWQPSLSAQIRNRLALAGISVAQAVTFITYSLIILFVLVFPFAGLNWWLKRRNARAS